MGETTVSIDQGLLKGKLGTDINGNMYHAFLGIPYAKPPLREYRFKAPQPPDKWEGVRDATKDGDACYSRDPFVSNIIGSEDCLVLNVFTPELSQEKTRLKPVMVFIHGGGFTSGSSHSEMFGPKFLLTENVVLVAINYRLGLLGFLQLDDPEVGVPGNAGCKDMIMALKWIQSNIQHFGGDPNNITIFGESAGGAAVHLLMLSPMGKGLFHKVIPQSGCALTPWAITRPTEEELLQALECPYSKGKDILSYLQELPVEKILEAQEKFPTNISAHARLVAGPVIEKTTSNEPAFLCQEPLDIILHGNYSKVPLMIGYTAEEGLMFDMLERTMNTSQVIDDFEKMIPNFLKLEPGSEISKSVANKIKLFYLGDDIPSKENVEKSHMIQTDNLFAHCVWNSIKNHLSTSDAPIYLYRFSLDAGLNFLKNSVNIKRPGAAHADELGYLFKAPNTPDILPEDSIELKSVRRMVRLWTNFAKTGDPNPIEDVVWKRVSKDEVNSLDIGNELISCVLPDQDRMIFWDGIFSEVYQSS